MKEEILRRLQSLINRQIRISNSRIFSTTSSASHSLPSVSSNGTIVYACALLVRPNHHNNNRKSISLPQTSTRTFKSKRVVKSANENKSATVELFSIFSGKYKNLFTKPNQLHAIMKDFKDKDVEKQHLLLAAYEEGLTSSLNKRKLKYYLFIISSVLFIVFIDIYYIIPAIKEWLGAQQEENSTDSKSKTPKSSPPQLLPFLKHDFPIASDINVKFTDVIGNEEAKKELENVVHFLRDPKKFNEIGAKLPKGVLLTGPPGVGKTLLARAVAGEAGVSFIYTSGSDFDEMYVGVGALKIRKLFKTALDNAPCIIFIDEIDSVGQKRSESALNPMAHQTLNQLLAEIDGFEPSNGVLILGATNQNHLIDKALKRPGRFDSEVSVRLPSLLDRVALFEYYLKSVKHDVKELKLQELAAGTPGFSGADVMNIVNRAAIEASLAGRDRVVMSDLWTARDRLLVGPKRKRFPNEEENLHTAYREAAHAVVTLFTPNATPLHKVSIIPRNLELGFTSYLPDKEKYGEIVSELKAAMDVAMAGRIAEELQFGKDFLTDASSTRSRKATKIAHAMVTMYGMSNLVGPRTLEKKEILSETFKKLIDKEITRLLNESYDRVHKLLTEKKKELNLLAYALMQYETLDKDDVVAVLAGGVPKGANKIISSLQQVEPEKNSSRLKPFPIDS